MLSLVFGVFRLCVLALVILALGSWVHWRGRSISDHVATGLAQARHVAVPAMNGAAEGLASKARSVAANLSLSGSESEQAPRTAPAARSRVRARKAAPASPRGETEAEEISESERQKLRALIRDLNQSRGR